MASTRRTIRRIARLGALGAAATTLALPAVAGAEVYCVDVVGGDCTSPQPDFQTALDQAKGNAGPDTVRLGATTYSAPPLNGFNYVGGNGPVSIVGQSQGTTTLTVPAQPDVFAIHPVLVLDGSGGGSSVYDLTITLPTPTPPNANVPQYRGIQATTPMVHDVTINGSGSPTNGFGMLLTGGTVQDSTISLPLGAGFPTIIGITASASTTVEDSTIAADTPIRSSGTLTVRRTSLRASGDGQGVRLIAPGTASIESSTIDLGSFATARGIDIENPNDGGDDTIALTANHLTIANGGSTGIRVVANDPSATDNNSATLTNSVISGPAIPLQRQADNGDTANVNTAYSNLDAAANVSSNGTSGAGAILESNLSNLAPGFVDAGAGNFHLLSNSPLIDIGDPAPPAPGELDIDGDPREIFGKDSCDGPRRDIGADEFEPATPPTLLDCIPPDTAITSGPSGTTTDSTPTFDFTSTEAPSSFQCSVDGGAFTPCSSPFTTPALADGSHTFAVQAIDASSNIDPSAATNSFVTDTTGPDTSITGKRKVFTRKKKARVSFAFGTTEPGSRFECSVDSKPFIPCFSLFSTKLRLGKHLLTVRSTDPLGNVDATPASFPVKVKPKR